MRSARRRWPKPPPRLKQAQTAYQAEIEKTKGGSNEKSKPTPEARHGLPTKQ